MIWQPIETAPLFKTILTIHQDDLHPVCAVQVPRDKGGMWLRIIEGPEDIIRQGCGDHDPLYRIPTHWMPLMPGPTSPGPR